MMQPHPVPDVHARGRLAVERMTRGPVAFVGAREGTNQIQLRAGIDHPADAAQHSIHLSKCSESIDINGWKARSLHQKFLVGHKHPRNTLVASQGPSCVGKMTQGNKNHAVASSQVFARKKWSILTTVASAKLTNTSDYHPLFIPIAPESSLGVIAPAVDNPPPCPAAAGASNSGAS